MGRHSQRLAAAAPSKIPRAIGPLAVLAVVPVPVPQEGRENKGPVGRVELSCEKVAKQGVPHLNTNCCPERRAASQKEHDQVTYKSKWTLKKSRERKKKKKKKRDPPETGRAAESSVSLSPASSIRMYLYSEAAPVLSEPSLAMLLAPGRSFHVIGSGSAHFDAFEYNPALPFFPYSTG
jgi:hypothetical protein